MAAACGLGITTANAAIELQEGVMLDDILDAKTLALNVELADKGYRVVYGVAGINGTDGTSSYVNGINTAYQLALANAYTQMGRELGTERIKAATSARIGSYDGPSESLVEHCEDQLEAEQQAQKAEDESFTALAKNVLKAFAGSDSNESADKRNSETESVYKCSAILDKREIEDIVSRSLADVFSGARVIDTVIHEGRFGLILGVSNDTAEVAGMLAAQSPASNPNADAFKETQAWISGQLESQTGSVIGLLGTRMKRLSNGEWALVGFGVAPASKVSGSSVFQSNRSATDRSTAEAYAARELSRFASMSVDFRDEVRTKDIARKTVTKELRSDSDKLVHAQDAEIARAVNTSFDTTTSLDLKGAQRVMTRHYKATETAPAFYLSVYAWSPSLLALSQDFRGGLERSFEAGKSGSTTNKSSPSTEGGSTGSTTSAPAIHEDW